MRLLVDENGMDWDEAWDITRQTFAYTNHTLLPEALERWPLGLFGRLLPRHLEIIYEINRRFLDEVRIRFPGDDARIARLSLIDESGDRYVRMAHLACVGSHAINGVAALHTELLKQDVLQDFHALWPDKFSNKTNGVTPRRWMVLSNPELSELITDAIGDGWIKDLGQLRKLEPLAEDPAFQGLWRNIKRANKQQFAAFARQRTGIAIDPDSLFDVQVKRIHEYKRQHLNILHVIALYCRLRADPGLDVPPRTFIFGGKAAPGYHLAKLIIKLINAVGDVVNRDPAVRDRIKVVFLPNFNVSNGQRVYPAADLSEQISTAGKEASGTGNMKFSMNGALTIGTLDGANIEIRDEVGAGEFLSLRPDRRRSLRPQGPRLSSRRPCAGQPGTARGDRSDAGGIFLPRRCGAVPAPDRRPAAPRSLPGAGRLPALRRLPERGEPRLRRPGALDAHVHPQRGALRQVLVGSHDPRILRGHLAGEGSADPAADPGRSEGRASAIVRRSPPAGLSSAPGRLRPGGCGRGRRSAPTATPSRRSAAPRPPPECGGTSRARNRG